MMEYIILNFWLVLVLVVGGYFFVDPRGLDENESSWRIDPASGAFRADAEKRKRFGGIGDGFLARYGLMLKIVSMPYP